MRVVSYTRTTSCRVGDDTPSDVIKQQNDHIALFCKKHGWNITHKYSDRKWNPDEETEFRQLLEDGMKRQFDLVVVDSVYRSGSYIGSAREVLCKTFHYSGIAFAIVEDDFISIGMSNEEVNSYFEKKYDAYYRANVDANNRKRIAEGILTNAEVKYGYNLEDGKLVINEETASIVKKIFKEFLEGVTTTDIADTLNDECVLTPSQYRNMNMPSSNGWTSHAVRKILKNGAYTGVFIRRYDDIEVSCTCPVIITADIFNEVQNKLKANSKSGNHSRKSIYSGLIRDIDSSYKYTFNMQSNGNGIYVIHPSIDTEKKSISYDEVNNRVIHILATIKDEANRIKKQIETDGARYLENIKQIITEEMRELAFKLSELEKEKMNVCSLCGEDSQEYKSFYENLMRERLFIEDSFQDLETRLETMEKAISHENPWLVHYLNIEIPEKIEYGTLKHIIKKLCFDKCEFNHYEFEKQQWYELLPLEWKI